MLSKLLKSTSSNQKRTKQQNTLYQQTGELTATILDTQIALVHQPIEQLFSQSRLLLKLSYLL